MTIKLKHAVQKFNKVDAFNYCLNLLENLPGESTHIEIENAQRLVKYFLPTPPKKAKTMEQFVARFTSKKDIRHFLNYIYINDGVMYGCDGHIAVRAPTKLDDGYYCPKSLLPVEFEATYPDVDKIIDHSKKLTEKVTVNIATTETEIYRGSEMLRVSDKLGFDVKLLNRAINNFTGEITLSLEGQSFVSIPDFPEADILIMGYTLETTS